MKILNLMIVVAVLLLSGCNINTKNFSMYEADGKSCYASYPIFYGQTVVTIKNPSEDTWLRYTPLSDNAQLDNCGSTDLPATIEIYTGCDDQDTIDIDESVLLDITMNECGINYYTYIENMVGEHLFMKFPAIEGATSLDEYTVYLNEIGE